MVQFVLGHLVVAIDRIQADGAVPRRRKPEILYSLSLIQPLDIVNLGDGVGFHGDRGGRHAPQLQRV